VSTDLGEARSTYSVWHWLSDRQPSTSANSHPHCKALRDSMSIASRFTIISQAFIRLSYHVYLSIWLDSRHRSFLAARTRLLARRFPRCSVYTPARSRVCATDCPGLDRETRLFAFHTRSCRTIFQLPCLLRVGVPPRFHLPPRPVPFIRTRSSSQCSLRSYRAPHPPTQMFRPCVPAISYEPEMTKA